MSAPAPLFYVFLKFNGDTKKAPFSKRKEDILFEDLSQKAKERFPSLKSEHFKFTYFDNSEKIDCNSDVDINDAMLTVQGIITFEIEIEIEVSIFLLQI